VAGGEAAHYSTTFGGTRQHIPGSALSGVDFPRLFAEAAP